MGDMADYYRDSEMERMFDYHGNCDDDEMLNDFFNLSREKVMLHKSKDGSIKTIRLEDAARSKYPIMDNRHLINTIRFIKRVTKNGIAIPRNTYDIDAMWEEELTKKEARKLLGLKHYKAEAIKRGITWKQEKILL